MKLKSLCCGIAALFAIGLANAGAVPLSFDSGDTPIDIPDAGSTTSTITVTGGGRVLDINALLNISHTWDGDLVLTLSHGGTTVILSNRNGGSGGADYTDTLFDDSAYTAINAGYAYAPYTGAFKPEEALSAFDGQDIAGDWTLGVADMEEFDTGVIQHWSLQAEVPEPASPALFALALAAMAGGRRRRGKRA
jgi:subtilisin-like proprotein convertase family protein